MKRRKIQDTWYSLHNLSFHNYLPEWRWLVVDIYQAAKRWGKYPSLATNTLVNGFFKYKLKQWNNIAQKADFASLQRLQYYRTQMPNELLRGEQQSIFRVWVANQSAPIHFFLNINLKYLTSTRAVYWNVFVTGMPIFVSLRSKYSKQMWTHVASFIQMYVIVFHLFAYKMMFEA